MIILSCNSNTIHAISRVGIKQVNCVVWYAFVMRSEISVVSCEYSWTVAQVSLYCFIYRICQ